jgi:Short C-terminal domain
MPRGGFGVGFGRGGFGRGFGMRRFGPPLIMPMGGYGWGMGGGFGSPLLTSLLAGGVGYALGSNSAQQNQQQPPPYQPYPYPYQAPPQAMRGPASGADSGRLAQLKLLDQLHESGTLTDQEFESEKQRILNS